MKTTRTQSWILAAGLTCAVLALGAGPAHARLTKTMLKNNYVKSQRGWAVVNGRRKPIYLSKALVNAQRRDADVVSKVSCRGRLIDIDYRRSIADNSQLVYLGLTSPAVALKYTIGGILGKYGKTDRGYSYGQSLKAALVAAPLGAAIVLTPKDIYDVWKYKRAGKLKWREVFSIARKEVRDTKALLKEHGGM